MNNKILFGIFITFIILISISFYLQVIKMIIMKDVDSDYKNINVKIQEYDIEYCINYGYDTIYKYKIYKIKNYYYDSMQKFENQLSQSDVWKKEKFNDSIIEEFYDKMYDKESEIDIDNSYYYNKGNLYCIFDTKNAKLYYYLRKV